MTTPQFLALGGPAPAYIRQNLAQALTNYDGVTMGIAGADVAAGNLSVFDDVCPIVASAGKIINLGVNVFEPLSKYQLVTVMESITTHGGPAKSLTAVMPTCDMARADKITYTQAVCDYIAGKWGLQPNMISLAVGAPDGEARYWWRDEGLPQYQKAYPTYTDADLEQLAIDDLIEDAQGLAPLLGPGGVIRYTLLDPSSSGITDNDGTFALNAMRGLVTASIPIVTCYEALEPGRPAPSLYAQMAAPKGYQMKEGFLAAKLSDTERAALGDMAFIEDHIRDVVKGLGNG